MTTKAPTSEELEPLLQELQAKEQTPEVRQAITKIETQLREISEAG